MRVFQLTIIAVLVLFVLCGSGFASTDDDCSPAELKAFDFLVGEWKESAGKGGMTITKVLEGCGIREDWRLEGFNAVLLRTYVPGEETWYLAFAAHDLVPQVWKGKLEEGTWVFYRDWELDGKPRRSRTFWKKTPTGFEKIVEQLNDDKKSWRLHSKSMFSRVEKKPGQKN